MRDDQADEARQSRCRFDGGARPEIAPQAPAVVTFLDDYPVNSIVIDTRNRKLYYVLPDSRAYEYAISVGREGFNWTGTETVSRKQAWPDWYPPVEMRERDPSLPEKMNGGLKNPLGALALYLGNTLYRIHGPRERDRRSRRLVNLPQHRARGITGPCAILRSGSGGDAEPGLHAWRRCCGLHRSGCARDWRGASRGLEGIPERTVWTQPFLSGGCLQAGQSG